MKIGKLQSAPWYLKLLMFVAVAGVVYAGFWNFVTKPVRAETKVMNVEIADLVMRNAQAQIASQRLNEFRAVYKAGLGYTGRLKHHVAGHREVAVEALAGVDAFVL